MKVVSIAVAVDRAGWDVLLQYSNGIRRGFLSYADYDRLRLPGERVSEMIERLSMDKPKRSYKWVHFTIDGVKV